ncbi:MAG: hypothetical protein JWM86_1619 [Thermoleophilia bacterium]|nr:hypothetical protein [Thermoleophilia bacterium]
MRVIRILAALGATFALQRALRPHMPKLLRILCGLPAAVTARRRDPGGGQRGPVVPRREPAPLATSHAPGAGRPDWLDDRDVDAGGHLDPMAPGASGSTR